MTTAMLDLDVEIENDTLAAMFSDVRVSIVAITPEIAKEMLEHNTRNRKLNCAHVEALKGAFRAGEMVMNGETIIFGVDDTLLNGQHRLTACVESGRTFISLVVRGIDTDAFKTIDLNRVRSAADALQMDGVTSACNVAAAVQSLVHFVERGGNIYGGGGNGRKATPTLCERVLHAHPGLRDSVRAMKTNTLYRNQHAVMLHYLFASVDRRLADSFARVLAQSDSDVGRPFVRLRESLIVSPVRNDTRRAYAAKAIKAFNAERAGLRPKMFKFTDGEEFPTIDGLDYERLAESFE